MPFNVQFDFARPLSPRIVEVFYASVATCDVVYYDEVPSSSTGESAML